MAVKASATITLFDIVDIDGITIYYLLQSSTANPPSKPTTDNPGGNWTTSEPTYVEGSTNTLYTVTKTKFSDGTFEYTPVSKSSSYEAAKLAYNKAYNAENTLNNYISSKDIIVGTQTATTRMWRGSSNLENLTDGTEIIYWLPYAYKAENLANTYVTGVDVRTAATTVKPAGTKINTFESGTSSSANSRCWLNLKLKNGSETGWIPCYYSGTSRITSHYAAGNSIRLIYRVNANIAGVEYTGWWADANYNTNDNTYDRIRFNNPIVVKTAITAGNIIVGDSGGYFKLAAGSTFNLDKPILYCATNKSAGASDSNNNYLSMPSVDLTKTISNFTGTADSTVYLVGIINGNMFTIDSTTPLTTTIPTTDDGKYYISLGYLYRGANHSIYLYPEHPIYKYVNGSFKNLNQVAYEAQNNLDNLEIGGRNLLKMTKLFIGNVSGTSTIKTDELYNDLSIRLDDSTSLAENKYRDCVVYSNISNNQNIELKAGDIFTLSFWIKGVQIRENATSNIVTTYFYGKNDYAKVRVLNTANGYSNNNLSDGSNHLSGFISNEWKRYWVTWQINPAATDEQLANDKTILIRNYWGNIIEIAGCKLERGNVHTDWTPAPEDEVMISSNVEPTDTSKIWFNTNNNLFFKYNTTKLEWEQVNDISGTITDIRGEIDNARSYAEILTGDIDKKLNEQYFTKQEFQHEMRDYGDSIVDSFSTIVSTQTADGNKAYAYVKEIEASIKKGIDPNTGMPYISLSTGDPEGYSLRIQNDSIIIYKGNDPVSNWYSDKFDVATIISKMLSLGNFGYVVNDDNSLSFRKVK